MLNKSLAIIIDDFSDRIFQYDNVTLYDYGTFTVSSTYDFFYNTDGSFDGYGVGFVDNDYIETLSVNSNDFFRITPSNNSSYDFISDDADVDFINLSDQQQTLFTLYGSDVFEGVKATALAQDTSGNIIYDNFGFPYLHTISNNIIRQDTSDTTDVNHGDWVIEALTSALDRPELTEIICIDVDTLNGTGNHFGELFSIENDEFGSVVNLESILYDYFLYKDIDGDLTTVETMRFPTMSVSIAGGYTGATESINLGEAFQMPVFQAAPNVNQGIFDWGSFYPDIVNVGAWNVNVNNELLISSIDTFNTIDIVADGSIINSNGIQIIILEHRLQHQKLLPHI